MSELSFPDPPLRAGDIWLRPWSQADVPDIVAACQDPTTSEYSPAIPRPYTEADAVAWLEGHEPARLAGTALELAVARSVSEEVLGAIAVEDVNEAQRTASIGYWLAPHARGHGYMTSAVRIVARWMFDRRGFARLQVMTHPSNLASQGVARRCGFRQEGHLRSNMVIRHSGERRDSIVWGLLPSELTAADGE